MNKSLFKWISGYSIYKLLEFMDGWNWWRYFYLVGGGAAAQFANDEAHRLKHRHDCFVQGKTPREDHRVHLRLLCRQDQWQVG